jgi:hypothetical protein
MVHKTHIKGEEAIEKMKVLKESENIRSKRG